MKMSAKVRHSTDYQPVAVDVPNPRHSIESAENDSSALSSYDYDEEFELLVKAYLSDMNYTTLNQAALNIVYSIINAGLVALPFVAQEAGIPMFVGVILFVSLASAYTAIMVISMANEQRVRTLEDLAECAFGRKGYYAVCICQILFSFSLMCITLDMWADIMSDVFSELSFAKNNYILSNRQGQVFVGSLLILPCCILKKSMSSLKWTSYITVFAVIASLLAVIATYVTDKKASDNVFTNNSLEDVIRPKSEWWAVIFISVFCFSCNQKVFTIYSSLRRRTADRWQKAVQKASFAITVLYLIFGVMGYISKNRKDIRLDNFNFFLGNSDERKEVFDPARCMVAFSLLLTIPVDCLVAATTWRRMYFKFQRSEDDEEIEETSRKIKCCTTMPFGGASESDDVENRPTQGGDDDFKKATNDDYEHVDQIPTMTETDEEDDMDMDADDTEVTANRSGASIGNQSDANKKIRKKYRRKRTIRKSSQRSASLRFDENSYDLSSLHKSYSSSGTWSIYRSLLGYNAVPGEGARVEYTIPSIDKATASTVSVSYDKRNLSTVRESFNTAEGDRESGQTANIYNTIVERKTEVPTQPSLVTTNTNVTDGRLSSLDHQMFGDLVEEEEERYLPTREEMLPALLMWLLMIGVSSAVAHWMYLAATFSVVSTVMLMFIFPAIFYFRLGLLSDYQAKPLFGEIVPNRFYMTLIKFTGIALLLFDVGAMICLAISGAGVVTRET